MQDARNIGHLNLLISVGFYSDTILLATSGNSTSTCSDLNARTDIIFEVPVLPLKSHSTLLDKEFDRVIPVKVIVALDKRVIPTDNVGSFQGADVLIKKVVRGRRQKRSLILWYSTH